MKKEDVHKIIPELSEISLKKTGFELPENYFETVEDTVIATLKTENLQNKINSKTFKTPDNYFDSIEDIVLAKLKAEALQNKNNSQIPENYFETLETKVISEIKTAPKVISLKTKLTKFIAPIAIAASLLLVFVLNNNSTTVSFESLAVTDIESWIDNGSIDIDALSIASIYPDIELDTKIYSVSLTDEEVLDYLYEENLEELIYEN